MHEELEIVRLSLNMRRSSLPKNWFFLKHLKWSVEHGAISTTKLVPRFEGEACKDVGELITQSISKETGK